MLGPYSVSQHLHPNAACYSNCCGRDQLSVSNCCGCNQLSVSGMPARLEEDQVSARPHCLIFGSLQRTASDIRPQQKGRVGQNHIYTHTLFEPYIYVYMVISLPTIPYIHLI